MSTSIFAVTVDCADAARLAAFWAEALDLTIDDGADTAYACVSAKGAAPRMMFIQVPDKKKGKNRVHLDLAVAEVGPEVELKRLVGLGARRLADFSENGARWTTLLDPEGNEFDLILEGA
jgi:predicted enzyme related to lactoylglutathione lyase